MSSKADFNLVVGAEISASYEEMRKDLKVIINTLNKQPYKIKLGLDMASWDKEVSKIKSDINEVRKSFAGTNTATGLGIKATNITGEIKPALSAIEQFNQRIKKIGVDNLDEGRLLNLFSSIGDALREDKVLADNFCEAVNKTYGVKYLEHLIFAVQRYSQNITTATELSKEFDSITNRQFTTEIPALATVDEQSINQLKALRSILRKSDLGWDDPYSKKKFSTYQASSTQLLSAIEQHATSAQLKVLGLQRGLISLSDVQGVLRSLAVNTGAISYNDGYGLDTFKTNSTRIREAISAHKEYEQQIASDNAALSELRNALVSTFGELPSEGGALVVTLDQLKQVESEAPAAMEYISQIQRQINGGLFKQEQSPAPVLEEVKTSVDQVVSSEQSLESATETVKGIFGSGINSEALISKLEEIRLSIERITTSLTELNSKEIKIKVDEASINSIKAEITQLVTQITEAAAKLNVVKTTKKTSSSSTSTSTKSQYQEASKAIKEYYSLLTELSKTETDITKVDGNYVSPSGKWEKLAASLNRVAAAFETLTGAESRNTMTSDEQAKLTQQLAAAEDEYQRKLEASTNKSEEAAARKEREAAAAEEAARAKREEAEAVKAAKAAQEEETRIAREAEAERKAAEATIRNYNNAVVQGESAIKRWSAAEHSRSKSSRDAYKKLIDSLNNLKSAESQYGAGSKEVADATDNFKRTLKETQAVLISNGDATQSLTTKFGSLAKKFGSWLTVSQAIMYAVRAVKKMVSTAKEIDYALTQLKIVTNATDNEMKQFADTAITLSKNLGKSVTELTKSIETFSRLGYSLKDASELAKYATIMSNVAGVGNDEATTGITSIVKGFNLNVSDAEHVADVLVDVGQKYAVSAGELMEAYEKSGAALSATNTSLEKSAGLIAAANASVQDASIVGKEMPSLTVMWEQVKNYIG